MDAFKKPADETTHPRFDYLVIGGGEVPRKEFLNRLASLCSNVVTVDRGADAALRMGAKPDLHVGDDDSFRGSPRFHPLKRVRLNNRKSLSDLEYALRLLPKKAKVLVVGGHRDHEHRTDHVFVNLMIVARYPHVILADEKMWIQKIKTPKAVFQFKKGTTFSVVSLSPAAMTIEGASFSLKKKTVKNPSVGLSNVSLGRTIVVKTRGPALIFVAENILSEY